jgi:hypothetical protein
MNIVLPDQVVELIDVMEIVVTEITEDLLPPEMATIAYLEEMISAKSGLFRGGDGGGGAGIYRAPLDSNNEFAYQLPSFQAAGYSHLNERMNILERQLVQEKRLRMDLEENIRRNLITNQNKQFDVVRGTNVNINDFLKESKEQANFHYYLTDSKGNLLCHCVGNPPAFFVGNKNYWMCAKRTRQAGKCCLFIPNALF